MKPPSLSRRTLLKGSAAIAAGGLAGAAVDGTALAAPAGFPTYKYIGTPFNIADLRYNPTGELIFPCIRGVYSLISNPLGRYYLYYAPHELPGGICMAYGDSLGGPFTEYPANPIVSNIWSPHYSVSHVSSPHVIWNAPNSKFYLYYHGENQATRMAWSYDGINFTYFGAVLTTADIPGSTQTSYARVFEYSVPGLGNTHVMLFMCSIGSVSNIGWGWSSDAKSWNFDPTPLVSPGPDGQANISSPYLLTANNTAYVVYHGTSGNMFLTEVGAAFDHEVHLGVFHHPLSGAPDNGRSAAPSFGTDGGVRYMFYEAGQRLHATIAVARAI